MKPIKDRINMPLLREALKLPIMMDYFDSTCKEAGVPKYKTYKECGTVGCIGGNVALIMAGPNALVYGGFNADDDSAHALGLTGSEAHSLFYPASASGLYGKYGKKRQEKIKAYVNAWLENNGVDERV